MNEVLGYLLENCPETLHFVVLSSYEPVFRLEKLHLSGEVARIPRDLLLFDEPGRSPRCSRAGSGRSTTRSSSQRFSDAHRGLAGQRGARRHGAEWLDLGLARRRADRSAAAHGRVLVPRRAGLPAPDGRGAALPARAPAASTTSRWNLRRRSRAPAAPRGTCPSSPATTCSRSTPSARARSATTISSATSCASASSRTKARPRSGRCSVETAVALEACGDRPAAPSTCCSARTSSTSPSE